jgi:hypothetical protein
MKKTSQLKNAIPVMPARNISQSVSLYKEKLSFKKVHQTGDEHAILTRDGVEIHLWHCEDKKIAENTSCRINVSNIEALYEECQKNKIVHPNGALSAKPWGMKEFVALDLSENGLFFQEPI